MGRFHQLVLVLVEQVLSAEVKANIENRMKMNMHHPCVSVVITRKYK